MKQHAVVRLTEKGLSRVLDGEVGMTFIVDRFGGVGDKCAMVRDYRHGTQANPNGYVIWALNKDGYEVIK